MEPPWSLSAWLLGQLSPLLAWIKVIYFCWGCLSSFCLGPNYTLHKVMLKILQARLQQWVNRELPVFKLDLEKAEELEIKWPTSVGSSKKQENSRKTSTSASLIMPKPLTLWLTTNCGNFSKDGIPEHLICLLRNLYAGQEATVGTGHGLIDWFQIRKGVRQGCILSPCI